MRKVIYIGDVSIPVDAYAIGGTALLGIRASGKTYCAKGIAEQLLEHRVPIIVFDPIGVWRHLKVPANKNGKGYPVVVAGGRGADLPLTPGSAQEIVRAAMRENIPLVVDLYDKTMSKSDWRRIVQTCFRTLLYENEGVRHIFLEEAAEYVPQKVMDGETYAEVEKLVRMGGNASLGITLINQRAQEVNKAVLDLCENLVLMRQMGAHAIDALEKWIDKVSPDFASKIAAGMPKMEQGEAWVFAGGAEKPIHTRSTAIRTYHPDRKNPDAKVIAAATDTSAFVEALQRALPAIVEQQQANDPKKLKAEVARLVKLLDSRTLEVKDDPATHELIAKLRQESAELRAALTEANHDKGGAEKRLRQIAALANVETREIAAPAPVSVPRRIPDSSIPKGVIAHRPAAPPREDGDVLSQAGPRACLIAIAQYPEGVSSDQLCALTRYAARSIRNYVGPLRAAAYISEGWPAIATDAGLAALGDNYEPLPTGEDLYRHWLTELDAGPRAVLEAIVTGDANGTSVEQLVAATSYAERSLRNYTGALKTRRLIEKRGGRFFAVKELF